MALGSTAGERPPSVNVACDPVVMVDGARHAAFKVAKSDRSGAATCDRAARLQQLLQRETRDGARAAPNRRLSWPVA